MAENKELMIHGEMTPVWELHATAQQIDEAVARALPGGEIDSNTIKKTGGTINGRLASSVGHACGAFGASMDDAGIRIEGGTNFDKGAFLALHGKDSWESGVFLLVASNNDVTRKELKGFPDGGLIWDNKHILHTGNKPSGSYTGNGDATTRGIDIGGIGGAVLIWSENSENGFALVMPKGNIISRYNGAVARIGGLTGDGNKVYISTADASVNANGVTYYYQVL